MKIRDLLPILALPAIIYSFIVMVLNDDVHVFLGAARLTDYFGSFPSNIDAAWELKPIGNRFIFYVLYKIIAPVIGNEVLVQVGTKALVAALGLVICAYFALKASKKLRGVTVYGIFTLTALAVFTVHTFCALQSEFFATLGSILAIGLMLSEKKDTQYLAGAVMLGVILIKLITVVFIPLIIITWLLLERYLIVGKMHRLLYGFLVATGVFAVSCLLWFPNFISDSLLLLSLGHPTGTGILGQIGLLALKTPGVIWFIPFLFAGLIATALMVKNRIGPWKWILVSWVLALTIAFVQVEFWIYQYLPLVIPALTATLLMLESRQGQNEKNLLLFFIGTTLLIWFVACSMWVVPHQGQWAGLERDRSVILTNYSSIMGQKVLYLEAGNAPYYVGAESACRYISPIMIQRATNFNPGLNRTDAYRDEMDCISSFNGEFIIFDSGWFGTHEPVNSKINDGYALVYQGSQWGLYKRTG